ncbi:unnamed protein product [Schistosoma turkestanicum]|nr:unnamed protein product [Schistosoma turkestanicum]
MNYLNLDVIYQAKQLLNETYRAKNYSDYKLNELLSRNLTLFWTTMHHCLNLHDLINYQYIISNYSQVIMLHRANDTTPLHHYTNLHSIYTWCNLGKSTWFTNVFTMMHHNSWQEKVSIELQNYLVPCLLFLNSFCLILCIVGIYRLGVLSNKSQQKILILMRYQSIVQMYTPATWPLLLWYCIFSLLWLILIFGLNIITSQYLKIHPPTHHHYHPTNLYHYNSYCRIVNYLKSILKYIPTWLASLMLCDRAIGEYRNRYQVYAPTVLYNHDDFVRLRHPSHTSYTLDDERRKYSMINLKKDNDNKLFRIHVDNVKMNVKPRKSCLCCHKNSYIHCIFHGLQRIPAEHRFQATAQSSTRRNDQSTPQMELTTTTSSSSSRNYEQLLRDLTSWNECGLSRIGGLVLFSIVTSIICLINTHLIWLYKIKKSTKRCILSAGDTYILSVFYPYLLKVSTYVCM